MKYVLEFEIDDLPKTINAIGRAHWAVKAKEAKKWIQLVIIATSGKKPSSPLRTANVTLVRCSSRRADPDGLVSSFKHVIDGLTRAGIIIEDKFDVIAMPDYKWEKAKKGKGKIKVRVESNDSKTESPRG